MNSNAPKIAVHSDHPRWMLIGDGIAELLIWLILMGGFFSYGYVTQPILRGVASIGCALLGCWSVVGWSTGRWSGGGMRPARWALVVFAVPILWCGLQLVPIPSAWLGNLSKVWSEIASSLRLAKINPNAFAAIAHSPAKALFSWNQLVAAAMFFSALLMLGARRHCAVRLLLAVALVSVIEGWWGFFSYALGGQRAQGAAFNSNHHAALVIMGMPIYFARLVQWKRFSPAFEDRSLWSGSNPLLLFYGLGIVALLGWLTSVSRGSLAFGAPLILLWLVIESWGNWREYRRNSAEPNTGAIIAGTLGVLFLAVIFGALLLSSTVLEDFARRGISNELGGRGRFELWRATLAGLMETPWLGLGLGGTENALNRFSNWPMVTVPIWSHNDFVQVVAELGIPASILTGLVVVGALFLLIREWSSRIRKYSWPQGLMQRASLVGVLITVAHATTDFHLRIPLIGFTFLILLALAVSPGALLISPRTYSRLFGISRTSREIRRILFERR